MNKGSEITEQLIINKLEQVKSLLLEKNKAYGDSALNPKKVFSTLSAIEALKIRIDDKLSRIANKGITDDTEDTIIDLLGYFTFLSIETDRIKVNREKKNSIEEYYN